MSGNVIGPTVIYTKPDRIEIAPPKKLAFPCAAPQFTGYHLFFTHGFPGKIRDIHAACNENLSKFFEKNNRRDEVELAAFFGALLILIERGLFGDAADGETRDTETIININIIIKKIEVCGVGSILRATPVSTVSPSKVLITGCEVPSASCW